MKIGYPQGIINTQWADAFSLFFNLHNIKQVNSPDSSQTLFLKGKKSLLDEFCLPVKIFAGHVIKLVEEEGLPIFIPFISGNRDRNSFLCPIEVRVTDILINSGILPKNRLISPCFIFDDNLCLSYVEGEYPGKSFNIAFDTFTDESPVTSILSGELSSVKPNILLLGRSYVVNDLWLNGGVRKSLEKLDVNVLNLNRNPKGFAGKKKSLSEYSHFALTGELLRGIERVISSVKIDGIIVLKPFLCGPDCGLESDILRFFPPGKNPPILEIVLDEHCSQEGRQTRLEAYVDLLTIRRERK